MNLGEFLFQIFTRPFIGFFSLIKYVLNFKKKVNFSSNELIPCLKVIEGVIIASEVKSINDIKITEIWLNTENDEKEMLFILIDTMFSFRIGHNVRIVYSEDLNIIKALDIDESKFTYKSENFPIKIKNKQSDETCQTMSTDELYFIYSGLTADLGYFMKIVLSIIFGFISFLFFGMGTIAIIEEATYIAGTLLLLFSLLMALLAFKSFVTRGTKAKVLEEIKVIEKYLNSF